MRLIGTVAVLAIALIGTAYAQSAGSAADNAPAVAAPLGDAEIQQPRNRRIAYGTHWVRCMGFGETDERGAIRSCGRIIGERITRWHTATALYNRAQHYNEIGESSTAESDLAEALRLFTDSIGAYPRDPYGYINRATLFEYTERYDEALADYERAIAADGDLGHPNYRRGAIFFNRGDYASATAEYDEASRKAPEQPYYHAARCEGRAAAGADWETARAACEEAIRIAEQDAYVYFSRGFFRFRQGDYAGALADFSISVERNAESAPGLYGRGVAAIRLGRHAEGQADIDRGIALDEDVDEFYGNAGLRP